MQLYGYTVVWLDAWSLDTPVNYRKSTSYRT